MAKYRKKPITVEAFPVAKLLLAVKHRGVITDWSSIPLWLHVAYDAGQLRLDLDHVRIHTLEGVMLADGEDYIVRGITGELYPCRGDIFRATYDPVED